MQASTRNCVSTKREIGPVPKGGAIVGQQFSVVSVHCFLLTVHIIYSEPVNPSCKWNSDIEQVLLKYIQKEKLFIKEVVQRCCLLVYEAWKQDVYYVGIQTHWFMKHRTSYTLGIVHVYHTGMETCATLITTWQFYRVSFMHSNHAVVSSIPTCTVHLISVLCIPVNSISTSLSF